MPHARSLTGIKVDAVEGMIEEGIVLTQRSNSGIKEGHVVVLSSKGYVAVQLKVRDFLAKFNGVDYKIVAPPDKESTSIIALNVMFTGAHITGVLYNTMQMRAVDFKFTHEYELYYAYTDYPRVSLAGLNYRTTASYPHICYY